MLGVHLLSQGGRLVNICRRSWRSQRRLSRAWAQIRNGPCLTSVCRRRRAPDLLSASPSAKRHPRESWLAPCSKQTLNILRDTAATLRRKRVPDVCSSGTELTSNVGRLGARHVLLLWAALGALGVMFVAGPPRTGHYAARPMEGDAGAICELLFSRGTGSPPMYLTETSRRHCSNTRLVYSTAPR